MSNVYEPSYNSLDPKQIVIERVVSLIVIGVLSLGGLIGLLIWATVDFGIVWLLVAGGAAVTAILLAVASWFWAGLAFRYTGWRVTDQGLEIRRGVLWRHRISVPLARVQHSDVAQGPLQRMFDVGRLIVHTAGTHNASVELDGLSHAQAIRLRDQLISQRESFDVV